MFTVNDLQKRYAVSEHTVLKWIRTGELKALNVGRTPRGGKPRWRITAAALEAFEAGRSPSPAPTPPPRKTRGKSADVIQFYS